MSNPGDAIVPGVPMPASGRSIVSTMMLGQTSTDSVPTITGALCLPRALRLYALLPAPNTPMNLS
jgi:hypothetical protein